MSNSCPWGNVLSSKPVAMHGWDTQIMRVWSSQKRFNNNNNNNDENNNYNNSNNNNNNNNNENNK